MSFATPKTFVEGTSAKASDVNENFDAIEQVVNELLGAVMPVGTLIATARPSAPTGYLLCEGQAVSRTKYAGLFGAIGTAYGKGDGSTTFNLPDLRGRVPAGVDGGAGRLTIGPGKLGNAGGDQRLQGHTHDQGNLVTDTQNALHSHHVDQQPGTRHEGSGFAYDVMNSTPGFHYNTSGDFATHSHNISGHTGLTGSGGSENLPPYLIVNWAIKT